MTLILLLQHGHLDKLKRTLSFISSRKQTHIHSKYVCIILLDDVKNIMSCLLPFQQEVERGQVMWKKLSDKVITWGVLKNSYLA